MRILAPALIALVCASAAAQNIRTLKVEKSGDFMAAPVLRLGSDDRITVSFDDISDDWADLQYRLVHCNADWTPSALVDSEYLDGFNIDDVDDWAFSQNTFIHFVNYRIEIPNENISPTLSGNYRLEVFHRDRPDETLAEARFSVAEQSARVAASKTTSTDRGVNTEWQQLELGVIPSGVSIDDPWTRLKVILTQNGMEHTRRTLTTPSRVEGGKIIYSHLPELIFPAGNEFRRFETVSVSRPGMGVDSIRFAGPNYHVWLAPDRERASRQYSYDQTQQGRFMVRESNSTDSDLGADYVTVHFRLNTPEVVDADVYVEGEFTGWGPSERSRMRYDHSLGAYLLEMPLKQGSYNYRYAAMPRRRPAAVPDSSLIEGNKHETRNEYRVQVWYRPMGARADRLISDTIF